MRFCLLIIALLCMSFGCSKDDIKSTNSLSAANSMSAASEPKDGDYEGRGTVTKIDLGIGSVEMDHEEVVGLMPAMRMEFYVSDKKLLDGLSVDDTVDFIILYKGGSETITRIGKSVARRSGN